MRRKENKIPWLNDWPKPCVIVRDGLLVGANDKFTQRFNQTGISIKQLSEPIEEEVLLTSRDGVSSHHTVTCFPLGTNEQVFMFSNSKEETQENTQKINANRYDVLSNLTFDGIVLLNDKTIIDCNKGLLEMLGFRNLEEALGASMEDLFSTREWRKLKAVSSEPFEIEFKNPQGALRVLNTRSSKIQFPGHKDPLTSIVFMDITEQKRIEQDLLQTKERFRLLVDSNPFGLVLLTEGRVRYANTEALHLLGVHDENEVFNERFETLFALSDRDRILEDMETVRSGEKAPYTELTLHENKNTEVGVQFTLTFFDRQPAIQIVINDLSTCMELVREQMRATTAEESNRLLKDEIEHHKQTQRKLREAERLNGSIIESSIDMIMAFDTKGNLVQYNHAASVEFGWTIEEAQLLSLDAFIQKEEEYKQVRDELQKNNYFAGEVTGVRASNEAFNLLMSVAMLRNDLDEVLGAVVVGRDITDLRIAEEELRSGEERYRDILDNATDLIFLTDQTGLFTYANPSFFKILGYNGEELSLRRIQDLVDEVVDEETWMDAFSGPGIELTFRKENGDPCIVFGGATTQRDGEGGFKGVRGIFLDVTEVRMAQQKAMVQSAKLDAIFNSDNYLMMFTINKSLKMTSLNTNLSREIDRSFGVTTKVGDEIITILKNHAAPGLYKGQLRLFQRAIKGDQQQFELPLINTQKEVVWYQVFVIPILYSGEAEELSCIAYDITDRKHMDQQILDALKEKEVLLQEVHHRVKNNLQVISSMLNLQRRFVSDPMMLDILDESQNRITTMSFIHESLYQNSDFSAISFAEYLERLSINLIHSYEQASRSVELETKLDMVHLNLKQAIPCGLIVNELVSNSLKYAFVDRAHGILTLRVEKKGADLEIEVSDNGVGLPPDFNFESNESLGVYLVQALVDQLDGELVVDNNISTNNTEKPTGSSFLVRFTPLTD